MVRAGGPLRTARATPASYRLLRGGRRLPKVASEMALHVLAHNMKHVMQILGVGGLMAAMRA